MKTKSVKLGALLLGLAVVSFTSCEDSDIQNALADQDVIEFKYSFSDPSNEPYAHRNYSITVNDSLGMVTISDHNGLLADTTFEIVENRFEHLVEHTKELDNTIP